MTGPFVDPPDPEPGGAETPQSGPASSPVPVVTTLAQVQPDWASPTAVDAARRSLPGPDGSAALDRIAGLASRLLGVPSEQISLLTEVQTIAGGSGLAAGAVGSTGPLADSLCTVTARGAVPLVVTRAADDARVNQLPPVTSGNVGSYLGVPLRAPGGDVTGALCVFDPTPHTWSDSDLVVLQHLAESVQAELELIALGRDYSVSRTRFDLAAQAGDIGSFDWDLVSDDLQWDDRLIAIFGYDSGEVRFDRSLASVNARLHPEDVDLVSSAIARSIAEVATLQVRYRIVVPGRGIRWLEARGRTLADQTGTAVRMLGVTWDVTDRHDAEGRADQVLASMLIGYLGMDADFRVTFVNAEGERILGLANAHMVGETIWELFPGTVGTQYEQVYRRVATQREPETLEAYYPAPLNAWFEIRVVPTPDGIALYFLDITDRHDAEQLVQLSVDAAAQLADVGSVDAAVSALARVVVPRLADWTIVSLVEPGGAIRDVQAWHANPDAQAVLERYAENRLQAGGSGAVATVIATGEPFLVESDVVGYGETTLKSAEAVAALRQLAPESAAVVPLIADGAVAGVLTLGRGASRSPMADQELAVTVSTCRRAGLAVENARLHAAQMTTAEHDRTVAQALQRALLTTLPQPDHLGLVARYLTAADGDQVGGDWYDALVAEGGALTVMIGDVVGHDIAAAAVMGQLRTILRVFALQDDEAPSTILERLDHAAQALKVDTMATVLAARIEQSPDDRASGLRTLRWSSGGHPPPVLVLPNGDTEVLHGDVDGPNDTLLGVAPDRARHDHARQIPPGSTVVLYTDGLVETRDADLETGIERLRAALTRHHRLTADDQLDAVIAELVGAQPDDDVAVLAVRFNREDRPRPADAGPAHL